MTKLIDRTHLKERENVKKLPASPGPIGVFDSGYGGLTILYNFRQLLPDYDYIYLGDNGRAPYGPRTFEEVYQFTAQAVYQLFSMGCHLVILGCNTASAKALRSIQQHDLEEWDSQRRVLGIIRPTAEVIGELTKNNHVGLLATEGTVNSKSYDLEIHKLYPDIQLSSLKCPFWVPLVEYNEASSPGADYFVKERIDKLMQLDTQLDTIVLGCTHYPLLMPKIKKYVSPGVKIVSQGKYVAESLRKYLSVHPEIDGKCTKNGYCSYFTTENPRKFEHNATLFMREEITAEYLNLSSL